MKCKICGTRINEGEKFCPKCGTEAGTTDVKVENLDESVEKKYCPDCGSLVLGEHRFCVKCGAKLDSFVKEQNIVETEKQETHIIKENSNGNIDSSTSVNTSAVKKYTIKKYSNGFWQCPACGKMNTPEREESCFDCELKLIDHEINQLTYWICPDCYQINNELNKKCWGCSKRKEEPEEDKSENEELNQIEDSKKKEPVVQIITSSTQNEERNVKTNRVLSTNSDIKFKVIGLFILVIFLLIVFIFSFNNNGIPTYDSQGIDNYSESLQTATVKDFDNKLNVWSFTDELDGMIKNYFEKDNRYVGKYNIDYTLIPTDQFPNKLDPVLASGSGCPDIFALEDAFVRKYVESGLLLDLTDVYNEVKDKMIAYPAEVGSAYGKVYALSWQVTPGALFYRRSLARKYLGTDDPVEVQKYLCNWEKFLETAEILKRKSYGNCYIVSSIGDIYRPYASGRKTPWVVNDKLVVDPIMEDYMEMCKTLKDRGLEGRVGQWSEGWFAGMMGDFRDEVGNNKEIFSYFLPTWGLHYVIKTKAPWTSGDWAMIKGPTAWRWGGTWIGAWAKTKNPNAAKELIKYITTDDTFLENWVENTGDVVSNAKVVNKVKSSFAEPFLGGQNQYAEFAEIAKSVDGKLSQGTDQYIEWRFNEAVDTYIYGKKSKSQALVDFRNLVITDLSWIK